MPRSCANGQFINRTKPHKNPWRESPGWSQDTCTVLVRVRKWDKVGQRWDKSGPEGRETGTKWSKSGPVRSLYQVAANHAEECQGAVFPRFFWYVEFPAMRFAPSIRQIIARFALLRAPE